MTEKNIFSPVVTEDQLGKNSPVRLDLIFLTQDISAAQDPPGPIPLHSPAPHLRHRLVLRTLEISDDRGLPGRLDWQESHFRVAVFDGLRSRRPDLVICLHLLIGPGKDSIDPSSEDIIDSDQDLDDLQESETCAHIGWPVSGV